MDMAKLCPSRLSPSLPFSTPSLRQKMKKTTATNTEESYETLSILLLSKNDKVQ